MIEVEFRGEKREFEDGVCFQEIAAAFQPQFDAQILLVHDLEQNRLIELFKKPAGSVRLDFLTLRSTAGHMTYARSATLMMLKAFYEEVGFERVEKVGVEFSIGGHFYILPKGAFHLTDELLQRVAARMRAYAEERIPFKKVNIHVDTAAQRFAKHHMYDKSKLFHYRRVSRVNVYSLDGFEDYYYGAMCPDAGYVRVFSLRRYKDGFMLLLPSKEDPTQVAPFCPSEKLFAVQNQAFRWAEQVGVETIADLNDAICKGEANNLILMQEAYFEKKIGEIAQHISNTNKRFVLIAGPSSSGKTSTAHRLALQLRAYGLRPHIISADNYFKDVVHRPILADGKPDFESLNAVDTEAFNQDMLRLLAGERIELPHFNFVSGEREYKGDFLELGAEDVLIIEGIHSLNPAFSDRLPEEKKYRIYVSALTQLNIDEHNRIPTTDCRLLRRMVRDNRTRGYSAQNTISRWASVRAGEEENIFPYQDNADVMFNTAMIYELAVLKASAEPLLFDIPHDAPEYLEAKRLLKFLDYVLSVSPEIIPKTSILREFIGGSCFHVG